MGVRWFVQAGSTVAVRPWLWPVALRQLWRLRRRTWWRQAPFLPIPHADYLRFRMVTAYGDPDRAPAPGDVITYLHWCRAWPHVSS